MGGMNDESPASISINLTSAPVYGILPSDEELKAKLEKRKREALEAEQPPGICDQLGEMACNGIVWVLVMIMSALPWLVGMCFLLAGVAFFAGAVEAVMNAAAAAWEWVF